MADKLTPQQAQAVNDRGGRLLVSAAAGSGKTKVLVDRLMRFLTDPDDPANLDEFLIITYTKAAASELRGKIAAKLTERIAREPENRHLQKQMQRLYLTQISTVHGFCSAILREYAYRIDLAPDFRVADESECRELRETVLKDLLDRAYENQSSEDHFRDFVDTQGVGRNDSIVPEIIQKVFDSARCHLDPEGWLDGCLTGMELEQTADASESIWGRYLMDDLFRWLDRQIAVLKTCTRQLEELEGMEKPALNFRETVEQLDYLRSSNTWDEVCARKDIRFGTLSFPRKNNPDPELTERVKAIRNACKEGIAKRVRYFANDSAKVMEDLRQSSAAAAGLIALVRQFDADYRRLKRGRRVLDFGDLEHCTLDLLLGKNRTSPTAAAREIGGRYREIMVDEYQDSNGVQDAIFSVLTQERQNCFLVGDVKQSIYQFRLADPGIFLKKYREYGNPEESQPGQGRKVLLSHNFRSGGEVVEGINDVFRACMSPEVGGLVYGEAEALREGIPHAPLPDPAVELYVLETQEETGPEEAAFAASRIRQMLDSGTLIRDGDNLRRVQPEDIVILLRSPGSAGPDYRRALEAEGIRCTMDGGMDLMQTEEVTTLTAFLQTIANPRQDIPLLSVLASPVFGFTADDLASLRGRNKKQCIYDALCQSDAGKAEEFLKILTELRAAARMEPLTNLLEKCLLLTRMDSIYGAMPGGRAKKENLQMFFRLAADFEKTGLRSLDQFLEHLETLGSSGVPSAGSSSAGCVTIMSIHKSKGLEFPVVFLCNLMRKFNREDLKQQVLCDKTLGLGLSVADNQNRVRYGSIAKRAIAVSMQSESLSEELRVLYVAMTRARDRLVMTCAMRKPENKLQDIALRLSADGGKLLCLDADCPGDWILTAAMQRIEAGSLHNAGGRPDALHIAAHPWRIDLMQSTAHCREGCAVTETAAVLPKHAEEALRAGLSFQYAHIPATLAPSKQTATGRKGRSRDEEAMEDTSRPQTEHHTWRKPTFREAAKTGKAYGSAIHSAMQFLRYESCTDEAGVAAEVKRMVEQGYLTAEQGNMVNTASIAAFFESDIGRKLRTGTPYLREFKFSILDDGTKYAAGLEGEYVLLQGVVDCALLEADGITIVDFKTDHVTEDTLADTVRRYRPQLETYAEALARIYEMPVKGKYLYFFHGNRFAEV